MAKIYPLSEGSFTVGHDKQFVPYNPQYDELSKRPEGSLHVEIQPFLVITERDVIILDTGLGFHTGDGVLQIHDNLREQGYQPSDVTKVLLSHLHKDHASGISYSENGVTKITFPNAEYCIYRKEADYALEKGLPSYQIANIEPLLRTAQVRWLDGEEGIVDDYIRFTHSGGHCPYHVVYLIDDGEDKIFFGGDVAPQLKQMKMRYIAKYDYDGKKAMALRAEYAERGHREGWQFLFYHDVKTPVATL